MEGSVFRAYAAGTAEAACGAMGWRPEETLATRPELERTLAAFAEAGMEVPEGFTGEGPVRAAVKPAGRHGGFEWAYAITSGAFPVAVGVGREAPRA